MPQLPCLIVPRRLCAARLPALSALPFLLLGGLSAAQEAPPLKPLSGRVYEVEIEARIVETVLTTDTSESDLVYVAKAVTTSVERARYLDRIEGLAEDGSVERRAHFVLSASKSERLEEVDGERGQPLSKAAPKQRESKSGLVGRHLRSPGRASRGARPELLGSPALKAWGLNPALFTLDLESLFPKASPKAGSSEGKEFLGPERTQALASWPTSARKLALDGLDIHVAAFGKEGLRSVAWNARVTPPTHMTHNRRGGQAKGPSASYQLVLKFHLDDGAGCVEQVKVEITTRLRLKAPSRTFPAPPK